MFNVSQHLKGWTACDEALRALGPTGSQRRRCVPDPLCLGTRRKSGSLPVAACGQAVGLTCVVQTASGYYITLYVNIYIYVYICMCVYIYIYIHMYIEEFIE